MSSNSLVQHIVWTPVANVNTATTLMDIGKYFNNNAVSLRRAWMFATYQDLTAGAPEVKADANALIGSIITMQTAGFTGGGVITDVNNVSINGGDVVEFTNAIFEQPLIVISVFGHKRSVGGYPPAYQFRFFINLEYQFDTWNLELL